MDQLLPLHPILHSITSPWALVDQTGSLQTANLIGETQFHQWLCLLENRDATGPIPQAALLKNCLQSGLPTWFSLESGVCKLTCLMGQAKPLTRERNSSVVTDEPAGLLEWFPSAGNEKLRMFQEVSRAINSSLILEDIFESLGEVLHTHIPYQEAVIVILDDTQNGIKILVRMSEDGNLEITGEHNAFAGYEPVVDHILKHPHSHLYSRENLPASFLLAEQAASALVVPLINKGVVIGLIAMSSQTEGGFYQYQEELLNEVSAQLAVAVENAKLYWQTQAQAGREFLINQLTRSIRQSLDIDIILGTAVMELGKVLGVSRCFIRYFPENGQEKAFQYQIPGATRLDNDGLELERKVFQLRKEQSYNPFILNDVRDCPPQWSPQSLFDLYSIKSLAIIPILIRDKLVGSISLHQCDAYRAWVIEDIELLKAMGEHLGVALNQAQLFLELDQQKRALEQTLEELQQAQLYLIQSEKMAVLGQFVAGIAHEVNTPLGTMVSNNATLKVCVDKLKPLLLEETSSSTLPSEIPALQHTKPDGDATQPPATPHAAQILQAPSNGGNGLSPLRILDSMENLLSLNKLASTRIQEIVRNLRNFARLDESELKTVDICEGIESTLLLLQSAIDPNIQIIRQYSDTLPPIQCYPGLLNQVFMNLLVNASHAIKDPESGKTTGSHPTMAITIATRYQESSQTAFITIQDTGKGISPENLHKVFDPGFTTKGVGVGTGLGLALCYRIVEKHQGRISVHSVVNEGTSFTVEIPVHQR